MANCGIISVMSNPHESLFSQLEDLFHKAQQGNRDAYSQFLEALYPFVKLRVQQRLGDMLDCDDITQECLIGIHRSMETYDPNKELKPWIQGIIRHKVADYFRIWARRQEVDLEKGGEPVTKSPEPANTSQESHESLWSLIHRLPEPQKQALLLTKVSGLSCKEAAAREGISEAAFRKRVSRTYKTLREELNFNLEDPFEDGSK